MEYKTKFDVGETAYQVAPSGTISTYEVRYITLFAQDGKPEDIEYTGNTSGSTGVKRKQSELLKAGEASELAISRITQIISNNAKLLMERGQNA